MKRSTDRILTTHAGSLPRPEDLLQMLHAKSSGRPVDENAFAARARTAVAEIVRKQIQLGIDIVDDGEMSKPGFIHYINERLGGFEPSTEAPPGSPWAGSREVKSFPEFYEWAGKQALTPNAQALHLACTGPITYKGHRQLQLDIDNLKAALADRDAGTAGTAEAFIPAVSPTSIEDWQKNKYYRTGEEYLFAIADAMHVEYKAIVDAGFLLQVDDPHLVTKYILEPAWSLGQCRQWCEARVEALNHALRGIPEDRVRWHTCYGINMGPRVHDMQMKDVVDIILKVRAGAYSFEAANPRHEHEWRVWETVKLPEGKVLIPGMITQSSILVEHPELIADRIGRFARLVGRENLIAGADCGFATFAGSMEVHPSIVWAKFSALTEGARLATQRLWNRA